MAGYVHAVPNFSEGRRPEVIDTIVGELRGRPGVKLINHYPDADFNRTVVEVIGLKEPLKEALLDMAGKSYELIDMNEQRGDHPRIGAQDSIPVFPLANVTLDECVELAEEIGREVYARYGVPVYFTGRNARCPERRQLDFIRAGQYEGLKEAAHLPERAPDIGPPALHPTAGATIVSADGSGLVAVNVLLDTQDVGVAKAIARMVRGPSGGFTSVRAVGLPLSERGVVAVSMNMFDTTATPIYRAFNLICDEAARRGVAVVGTEIVGTLPQEALVNCAEHFLRLEHFDRRQIIENHVIGLAEEVLAADGDVTVPWPGGDGHGAAIGSAAVSR